MGELNTPYFLEQDGTIRNGQNEIVTEILDETTEYKELHKMIETLNGIGYLNLQLATAQAEVERLTAGLKHYANGCDLCLHHKLDHFGPDGLLGYCCDGCDGYENYAEQVLAALTANIASATGQDEQGEGK